MANKRIQAQEKVNSEPADAGKTAAQAKKGSRPVDHSCPQGHGLSEGASLGDIPLTHDNLLSLQRTIGNRAVNRLIQAKLKVGPAGDEYEREADRVASQVMTAASQPVQRTITPDGKEEVQTKSLAASITPLLQREAIPEEERKKQEEQVLQKMSALQRIDDGEGFEADQNLETRLTNIGGSEPLPDDVCAVMEPQFGADFSRVRVHTGSDAVQMNRDLNAEAFTHENDIYFGAGKSPGNNAVTAHELTHVIQQTGGARTKSISGPIADQVGMKRIQRTFAATYQVAQGNFEVDLQTRQGAVDPVPTKSGLDGYIRFVPNPTAPNSNQIVIVQIVKLTDLGGTDVNSSSMPAAQAPRGALGQPGLRTQDDPGRGIEGGFHTDLHHRLNATATGSAQGTAVSPRYSFQPAAPGTTGVAGQTAQPAMYGGGIGGVIGQTPGFKRSSDPSDIRSAAMYDFPGTPSSAANLNFSFESVVRGEDTMITYGAVNWGFGLRAGRVVNEYLNPVDAQSATFDEALERHRDFYVHEPVTFYFEFDRDVLSAAEAAKIDTFIAYMGRNPDVHLSLEGFADIRGGASDYNRDLSLRRCSAVEAALLGKGIAANRIEGITIGHGASTAATTDAGTGDQIGGSAAVGADQDREANRQFNRRVVLTFEHVPVSTPAPAPGGTP